MNRWIAKILISLPFFVLRIICAESINTKHLKLSTTINSPKIEIPCCERRKFKCVFPSHSNCLRVSQLKCMYLLVVDECEMWARRYRIITNFEQHRYENSMNVCCFYVLCFLSIAFSFAVLNGELLIDSQIWNCYGVLKMKHGTHFSWNSLQKPQYKTEAVQPTKAFEFTDVKRNSFVSFPFPLSSSNPLETDFSLFCGIFQTIDRTFLSPGSVGFCPISGWNPFKHNRKITENIARPS